MELIIPAISEGSGYLVELGVFQVVYRELAETLEPRYRRTTRLPGERDVSEP